MRSHIAILVVILLVSVAFAGCFSDGDGNTHPTANAGADLEVEVGEEVVFTGVGIDSDGSVVKFRWDFDGDDSWDYEGEVGVRIHVYDRPGNYQAVLQVTDDEGATARDTLWVNVTATVSITVDWSVSSKFIVHVSEKLSLHNLEVDWSMDAGGPIPVTRTFTPDAGLEKVNETAYALDPNVNLTVGQLHTVKVRLGEVVVARRTVEVVDTSDAAGTYDALYVHDLWDERLYDLNVTSIWRTGNLSVESRIGWTDAVFEGNGSWYTLTNLSGVVVQEWVTFDEAAAILGLGTEFGETWWRYVGHGSMEQTSEAGFYIFAWVWDFEREMDNGSLVKDDWRRVGRYSGYNDTNGTFEWNRTSMGNQIRQNGEGELYEVLKIRSERSFEGTNLGRNFTLHNLNFDYDASRLIFDNRTIFRESMTAVGTDLGGGNWSWSNSTWAGYMDEDADEVYNPDTLAYDPQLGARFIGPRPRVLAVGDMFAGTNFYGLTVTYTGKRSDIQPMRTSTGWINVTGVIAEAIHNTTWGNVHHWFWVLKDGPLPGFVYEERIRVEKAGYAGGTYDWYRNIKDVDPLQ
jgi:hypothetical protein